MDPIIFFSNLADLIMEDEDVKSELIECDNIKDVYNVLLEHELVDFELADYLLLALQASDDIKRYLDPDSGEIVHGE